MFQNVELQRWMVPRPCEFWERSNLQKTMKKSYGSVSKPMESPVVHIKIAGKWMFIPLKMVSIGIDPSHMDVMGPDAQLSDPHVTAGFLQATCSEKSPRFLPRKP